MKICAYSICKNEKNQLEGWLDSIKKADYIVLLDTGSTDGTWETIQSHPEIISSQKIYENFDFGVARTDAFKLCPKDVDLCINLDLDERISENWRDEIEKNYKGCPIRCSYINADRPEDLGSKVIGHPYHPSLIWQGEILEEPYFFTGVFYRSYWDSFLTDQTIVGNIVVRHYKDLSKDRDFYNRNIRKKLDRSFRKIRNEDLDYEELMQTMYGLVESLNWCRTEYGYYAREAISKLAKKHLEVTGDTWVPRNLEKLDKYFLQVMQVYHKITGDIDEAVNYSLCLYNNLKGPNKSINDLIMLRDGVDLFISTNQIKKAYEIVIDNIYNKLEIKKEEDLVALRLSLETAEYFCRDIKIPFKFPALKAKVCKETRKLFETGSFTSFKLPQPKKISEN